MPHPLRAAASRRRCAHRAALALLAAALSSAPGPCQAPSVTELARFPPGMTVTYATPPGSAPLPEYSMCTGHRDPATGAEFAVAAAFNGLLFAEIPAPRDSHDDLAGVAFDTWFFTERPFSRWMGVGSFRDHVYCVQPFRGGIRRFRVDPAATGAARVVDLGISNARQLAWGLHRVTVDREHGHLYVCGRDRHLGRTALCIYDVFDEASQTVLDPPQLLAVWSPGGMIFDAHVTAERIFLAYQKSGDPRWWQILDRTELPVAGASPYSWSPAWGEWRNAIPGGAQLSHDGYLSPDGRTWYAVTEDPGYLTGRDLTALPPLTQTGTALPEPPVRGTYQNQSPVGMHSVEGVGLTGFVAHWTRGLHVIDLAAVPGGFGLDYPRIAEHGTSQLRTTGIGDGAWDCYPHQDSGLVYVNDCEEGLVLLRVDRGHLNRYGPGASNGRSVPRLVADHGPPRIGRPFVLTGERLLPHGAAFVGVAFREDPAWRAGVPQRLGGATVLIDPAQVDLWFYRTAADGSLQHVISIPSLPSLVGIKVFCQVMELLPGMQLSASRGTWFGVAP